MNRSRQDLLPAHDFGAEAGRILARLGSAGKILACPSGGIYFLTDDREIFWVGTDSSPMHRRCVRTSFLPARSRARPGQKFHIEPFLIAGDAFAVDLCGAKEWNPPPLLPEPVLPWASVRERGERLSGAFQSLIPGDGLGTLIPGLWSGIQEDSAPSWLGAYFSKMYPEIFKIAKACRRRDLSGILEKGRDLIGLGPGLTPSGDDFMGGLLFAAFLLQRFYPRVFSWDQGLVRVFLAEAQSRTHGISHAFLCDFASGYAPFPLEEVLGFLLQGGDYGKAVSAARQMLRFGHSSGGDMLAGLMTGMLMVPETQIAG
jgi:hypothetical protein